MTYDKCSSCVLRTWVVLSANTVTSPLGMMHGLPDPVELERGNQESILRDQGGQAEELS